MNRRMLFAALTSLAALSVATGGMAQTPDDYPNRPIRIVVPQVAIAIGSTIYGGRAPTIVAALIIGALGAFLSFKGYARRA